VPLVKLNIQYMFIILLFPLFISSTESMDISASASPSSPAKVQQTIQEIRPAPEYSASTLSGKPISLEEFQGNPFLINVWAT
jgi:hypothetical protein